MESCAKRLGMILLIVLFGVSCGEEPVPAQRPTRVILSFPMPGWHPAVNVSSQLDEAVGAVIVVRGFPVQVGGHAALRVLDGVKTGSPEDREGITNLVLVAKDVSSWTEDPSPGYSVLLVKGLLTRQNSGFCLDHTEHHWEESTPGVYHPKPEEIWPLLAKSTIIATGALTVPVEFIRSRLSSNRHDFVEIHVARDEVLKGTVAPTFTVRWYTAPSHWDPDAERVIAFNGKRALLFLVEGEDPAANELYFGGYTPRSLSDPDVVLLQQVQREVSAQRDLLAQFDELVSAAEEPLYEQVKHLIDETTRPDTQMTAFRQLEELGAKAVPSIIMLMDDRRDLGTPNITLRNGPQLWWESVRYYGPRKVVDAMDAILNQITGESFGQVYNGGTEQKRQEAVNGWRIYLYHWKKGAHSQAAEVPGRTPPGPQH